MKVIKFMVFIIVFLCLGYGCAMYKNEPHIGKTPLHRAAELGQITQVKDLISEGADLNVRDNNRNTPLHYAVYEGHQDIVALLVENGADVNTFNNFGLYPIHDAILGRNKEIAKYLVSNGADVNVRKKYSNAPIHEATKWGQLDLVKYLVSNGADINAKGQFGSTPLHYAVEGGKFEIMTYLISEGADVNSRNGYGNTPLHEAVKSNQLKTVQYLVSKGANVKMRDNSGLMPEGLAQKLGKLGILNYLANLEKKEKKSSAPHKKQAVAKQEKLNIPKKTTSILPPEVDFGNYYALVIGINNYEFLPKLKTAINDVQAVAAVLKQNYGFEVELLIDAKRSDMLISLGKLRSKLTKQDNLVIYYAGHGWLDQAGDEGYWLPINAEIDSTINWVSNSSITTTLKAMDAKHVLVIADSCYSGKLARGIHAVQRTPSYLYRLSQRKARSVISSGGLEPVTDSGGKGLHSVFASAFLDILKENTGIMDGSQLFSQLRRPVMLNSDQTPEYSDIRKAGHDGGEFLFLRKQ